MSIQTVDLNDGYVTPTQDPVTNTQSQVHHALRSQPNPKLDDDVWRLADDMIEFFRQLPSQKNYRTIVGNLDGAMIQACVEVAKSDEIAPIAFPVAVQIIHAYSKLRPRAKTAEDPKKLDAVITPPGEFFGQRDVPNRFFVKLVSVGDYDKGKGGNLFEVRDRFANIGFFYERPDKLKGSILLGDCVAIYAIPARHAVADSGEKHTVFRCVEIIENKGPSPGDAASYNDKTGMFLRS